MAGVSNEFLVTVQVTQLEQLRALHTVLTQLKAIADAGIRPINISTPFIPGGPTGAPGNTGPRASVYNSLLSHLDEAAKQQKESARQTRRAAEELNRAAQAVARVFHGGPGRQPLPPSRQIGIYDPTHVRYEYERYGRKPWQIGPDGQPLPGGAFARTSKGQFAGYIGPAEWGRQFPLVDIRRMREAMMRDMYEAFKREFGYGPAGTPAGGATTSRLRSGPGLLQAAPTRFHQAQGIGSGYIPESRQLARPTGFALVRRTGLALTPSPYVQPAAGGAGGPPTFFGELRAGLAGEAGNPYGKLSGFAQKFRSILYYAIAGGIIYGTVAGIKKATDELFRFEYEIAKIRGFFDDRSLAIKSTLESGIIKAAKDFGSSLSEVTRVTKLFAQAGYSPTEAIAQTRTVLRASAGLDISPEATAQTAISAKEISKGRVTSNDIFERIARVERLNAVTAEDLNTAVQRVGGFLTQLQPKAQGVVDGFDLVIGATTQIVEQTRVSGNQAANALKFIVARLSAPEVAGKLQKDFGIRLAANPEGTEFRPLREIFGDIAKVYTGLKAQRSGNADVEAARLLSTIAGARQIALAEALFSNFEKAMKVAETSAYAVGDLESRLKLQMDTVIKQMGRFGASFTGFLHQFFVNSDLYAGIKNFFRLLTYLSEQAAGFGPAGPAIGVVGTSFLLNAAVQGFGLLGRGKSFGSSLVELHRARRTGGLVDLATAAGHTLLARGYVEEQFREKIIKKGVRKGEIELVSTGFGTYKGGGKGINALAKILFGIESVFGAFTPLAIIGAFAGLYAVVKWLIDRKQRSPRATYGTYEDIDKSEFGQEYIGRANTLGKSPFGLVNTVVAAQAIALASIRSQARLAAEKPEGTRNTFDLELAKLANAKTFDDVLAGVGTNRAIREVAEQAFAKALFGALGAKATEALTGFPLDLTKRIPANQVAYAQQILRQSQQYLIAPNTQFDQQKTAALNELVTNLDKVSVSASLNRGFGFTGTLGLGIGYAPPSFLAGFKRARSPQSALQQLLPAGLDINMDKLKVQAGETAQAMSLTAATTLDLAAANWDYEKALQSTIRKFYTSAGGLSPEVVKKNQDDLLQSMVESVRAYVLGPQGEQAARRAGVSTNVSGLTPEEQFIRNMAQRAIDIVRQESGNTPEAAKLLDRFAKNVLSQQGLGYLANEYKQVDILATLGDRVAAILSKVAASLLEIQAIEPIFNDLGVGINAAQERLQIARQALRELAAVPGQLAGDVLAQSLKVAQLSAISKNPKILALGQDGDTLLVGGDVSGVAAADRLGINDDIPTPEVLTPAEVAARNKGIKERALLAASKRLNFAKNFLEDILTNRQLLTYASPDELNILRKAFTSAILTDPNKPEEFIFDPATLIQIFKRLEKAMDEEVRAQQRVTRAIENRYDFLKQRLELEQQLTSIAYEEVTAGVTRRFGAQASVGTRLASEVRAREDAIRTAQLNREATAAGIQNRYGFEDTTVLLNEMAKADADFEKAVRDAYNNATVNMARLLSQEETAILDDTQSRIRDLIQAGTSGLTEALKNPRALFGGSFGGTLSGIITPAAQTILGNTVDNLMRTLVGTGGLFEGPLGKFFGFNEETRKNAELKKLHTEATHDGMIRAFEDMGLVAKGTSFAPFSGLPKATGALGAVSYLASSGILNFGGGAAAAAAAGVPSILQGGYSLTGPNAGASPSDLLLKAAAAGQKAKTFAALKEQIKKYGPALAGQFGGAILGGIIGGKGITGSYSTEGASLGTAIGTLIPGLGPIGAIGGGLLGGLIGGLFGKKEPPKPPRPPQILEKIERNTRQAADALDNQNRMLFNLDSRLLNLPSSFTVPQYRPQGADGAGYGANYVFNISGGNAQEIASEVEKVLKNQDRLNGAYTSLRRGI